MVPEKTQPLWMAFWPKDVPRSIAYPEIPVSGILSMAAKTHGRKVAVVDKGSALTFEALERLSSKFAGALHAMGVSKGDRVMVYLRNSPEFIIVYYGILKAGGVVVSTSPMFKAMEVASQANDSGAETIVFLESLYPNIRAIIDQTGLKRLVSVGDQSVAGALSLSEILAENNAPPPNVRIEPKEDVAVIQYTGGTTGVPRGAMITHFNLVSNAIMNARWFQWTAHDRVMGVTPFFHTWGPTVCMNSVFYAGASVYVMSRFDPEACLEVIQKEKITIFYGVTSLWQLLLNHPAMGRYDLSSIRYVKAGGMPVLKEVKKAWEEITGVPLIPGYGLTEASPECLNNPPHRVKFATLGIPIIDTRAKVIDINRGHVVPPGREGELLIKGPQVMKGYWQRPEETERTLENGWLHTGDIVYMDEEGYFHFVERAKEMIKYKGYQVFPSELENLLLGHPSIAECAVIGRLDAVAGEMPVAFVVLKPCQTVTAEDIIEFCKERIAPYKRIREVRFVEQLPKTSVGKILKRKLRELVCH
jgi:long-chain acyl-CoA synthetase